VAKARLRFNAKLGSKAKSKITAAVAMTTAAFFCTRPPAARASDLTTVSQRVTAQLLSSIPSTSTVEGYMSSLQSNGSWSDIDYSNTAITDWTPLTHLQRLEAMAQDYSSSSSSLYHNATLEADISNAYNYWITANPMSDNWYDNDIAAPQSLGDTMILINSILSPTQISEGQSILGRAASVINQYTGQNTVDLAIAGIDSAIVSGSTSAMATAFSEIGGTIEIIPANGIQADDSYQFHGPQLYMGGYGTSYINDTLNWASIAAGTQFAITSSQEQLLVNYLVNGQQWFIRGQTEDLAANGRQVTYTSYVGAGDGFVGAIDDALSLGTYDTTQLEEFLARQEATISSGQASSTVDPLSGNRDFWDTEIMVDQQPGYYASVKVTSDRTSDPETGNDQGLENLYLGDGVNQIMVTGNEYLGIQPDWNWRRLPGTTVEQDTRSLTPTGTFGSVYGTTPYAGGVSDGTYGAEAFEYNRYDVAADKSWFFFDSEEFALGAAIKSSSTQYEVDTTLNQCLLTSTVYYETTSGTVQTLTSGTVTPSNLKWVWQGSVGYYFPNPVSNATIMAVAQSGSWYQLNTAESSATVTQNVFTLYIDQGKAVSNGTYAYIAVPGVTEAQMTSYSDPIQILTNTSTVQAVRNSTLDVTQAAFYSAGSFTMMPGQTISSSAPSTVMFRRQPNWMELSASSPEAQAIPLSVQLSGVTLSTSGTTWFDAMGTGTAGFNLPGGNYAASTVGITLQSNGSATPTVSLSSDDQMTDSSYTVAVPIALPGNTTFQEDSFTTLAFSGAISGAASLTETGAGVLVLSGTNSFSGGLNVNGGTVRLNSLGASSNSTVNSGGTLVFANAGTFTAPLTVSGGLVGSSGSPGAISNSIVTASAGTTSTFMVADPANPSSESEIIITGTLQGSGNLFVSGGSADTDPDAGDGFRLRGTATSDFTGTITIGNNTKAELQTSSAGIFSPAGVGTIVLTAGDHASGGLSTITSTGGYSELNLRNNSNGNATFGNNIKVVGTGLTLLNPLGTAPVNASVTMGNLTIGNGDDLGILLNSGNAHLVAFPSVTLTGGTVTFSPKPTGLGSSGTTGSDLSLGPITQTAASSIVMNGLRTLYLTGSNTYSGSTTVSSGILVVDAAGGLPTNTSLSIGSAGTAALVQLNSGVGYSTVSSLSIAAGSTLDLNGNPLSILYGTNPDPISAIQSYLQASYAAGWTGSGIISTQVASLNAGQSALIYSVGYADGADGLLAMPDDEVEIRPTLAGDAKLEGDVNFGDFQLLSQYFGLSGTWDEGNFTYGSVIDFADFQLLSQNFGAGTSALTSGELASMNGFAAQFGEELAADGNGYELVGVPEPASAALLGLFVGSLLARRRKR
jgi:chondroitin AC lyase